MLDISLFAFQRLVELGVVARADVTVVEPSTSMSIGASWQYVWTGRADMAACEWDRSKAFEAMGGKVKHVIKAVATVDTDSGEIKLTDGTALRSPPPPRHPSRASRRDAAFPPHNTAMVG